MIKIERKETEKTKQAIADLQKASENESSYNIESVNQALKEIFHGKCYICENKAVTSYQIEHLVPHRGDKTLKYDWKNLFWSCAHCNNIKSDKYEPILDCTKEPVEKMIAFRRTRRCKEYNCFIRSCILWNNTSKEDRSTDHKKNITTKSFKF